jgi:hypothetical protein
MASTDDKTNYYVDAATGSDSNGGHPFAISASKADTTAVIVGGTIFDITNNAADGWGTSAADDGVSFDAGNGIVYGIVSAVAGNVLTVDFQKSAAPTGTLTNRTTIVGGAWWTINMATDVIDNSWANPAGDPITIWVKNGSYNELATIDNAGTALLPITLEGYNTTEGDGWDYDWTGNLPAMDGDPLDVGSPQNDVGIRFATASTFWIINHIYVVDSAGIGFGDSAADKIIYKHCKTDNCLTGFLGDNSIAVLLCEAANTRGRGIDLDFTATVINTEVYGSLGRGIQIEGGLVLGCVVYDNVDFNIYIVGNTGQAVGNTVDGNYGGGQTGANNYGIYTPGSQPDGIIVSFNLIHNCTRAIVGGSSASGMVVSLYNQWDNNNSANVNWITGEGDVENGAGAPGFIDEEANNYQPTAASPANGAAGPTTSPSGNTITNRAVGAAEPKTNAAGKLVNGGLVCP